MDSGILDIKVVKISSWLTTGQKTFAAMITTLPIPIFGIWGMTPISTVLSLVTLLSGVTSIFFLRESGFLVIKTTAIAGPIS